MTTIGCVMVTRNDDYGEELYHRAVYALNSAILTYDEIILVDYNSPDVTLFQEMKGDLIESEKLRCIIVTPEEHNFFTRGFHQPQPCSEVLGRNIGLRRLTTDYLVSTNIDEIQPPKETFEKYLEPDVMITVARHGTSLRRVAELGGYKEVEKIRQELIATNDSPQAWETNRDPWSVVEWCGDLQLAHRDLWYEIRGFEEWQLGTSFADTYVQRKVFELGKPVKPAFDIPIYHIDHGRGNKFGESNASNSMDCILPTSTFLGTKNGEGWGFEYLKFKEERL